MKSGENCWNGEISRFWYKMNCTSGFFHGKLKWVSVDEAGNAGEWKISWEKYIARRGAFSTKNVLIW